MVVGYHLHNVLERLAFEALGGEDLADLFAFAGGDLLDLVLLAAPGLLDLLSLALGPLVVAHRHTEAIGEEVCEPQDDHHESRKPAPDSTCYHGEGSHTAVYT